MSTFQMFFHGLNRFVAKTSTSDNNNNNQDLNSGDTTSEDSSCYVETPVDQVVAGQPSLSQPQQVQPCAPIVIPTAVTSPIPIQSHSSSQQQLQQQQQQQQLEQSYGYPSPGPYLSPHPQHLTSPISDVSSPDRNRTNDFLSNPQASSYGSHSSILVPGGGEDGLCFTNPPYDQDFMLSDMLMNDPQQPQPHQLPPNADPGMLWLTPQHSPGATSQHSHGMQPPPALALTTTSSVETNNNNNYMQVRGSRASSCSQTPLLALGGSSIDSFGSFQAPPSQASSYSPPHPLLENNPMNNVNNLNGGGAIDIPQQQSHHGRQQSISSDFINPHYITTPILSISPAQASCNSSTIGAMMDNLAIASPSVQSEHSAFSQQFHHQQQQQQQQPSSTTTEYFDENVFQQQLQQLQANNDNSGVAAFQGADWDIQAWVQQTQLLGPMMYEEEQFSYPYVDEQNPISPTASMNQDQQVQQYQTVPSSKEVGYQEVVVVEEGDNDEEDLVEKGEEEQGEEEDDDDALQVPQRQRSTSTRARRRQKAQHQSRSLTQLRNRPQRRPSQRARRPAPVRRTIHYCPECNHTSDRANNMKEHVLTHDPDRPKNFGCDICKKRFARKYDMERHRKTHERRKKPRYPEGGTLVIRKHPLVQDADK
ncbi:hypothetical protein BDA99DRAFT_492828 [Phascolomyces articulosus]|uniref:C2H2-type domain-containing protein n=1 Tax=Phascolomyces articulosus TaxID=60185 RepID=A0AAD5KCF3_9FUNG|nr:hypothetical protein BDA99DRAFT_492828 [Phascolomyces articulosus]